MLQPGNLPSVLAQVCLVAYLGLFMLCVSYQVDERTCLQFAMKVSCHFSVYFLITTWKETQGQNERIFYESIAYLICQESALLGKTKIAPGWHSSRPQR